MSGWRQGSPDLGEMFRAGVASVRRYTGLTLAVYAIQLAISALAAFMIMRLLATEFAHRPLFDRGVDGDVAAMLFALSGRPHVVPNLIWIGLAAVVVYWVVSAPIAGGVISVFLHRPHGRVEVAGEFGRGAAVCALPYVRLAMWSAIPYTIAALVLCFTLGVATHHLFDEVSPTRAVVRVLAGAAPGAVLIAFVGTAVDYARIDLARHRGLSAWRALMRGFRLVVCRARPFVHTLLYWLFFAAVSALYLGITLHHPMAGAAGAVSLVILRQAVSIARFAARMVAIGGQVELSQMQVFPPRR